MDVLLSQQIFINRTIHTYISIYIYIIYNYTHTHTHIYIYINSKDLRTIVFKNTFQSYVFLQRFYFLNSHRH